MIVLIARIFRGSRGKETQETAAIFCKNEII